MDAGIRLQSITKRFERGARGDVVAVHDVSLEIEAGRFLTLLGPSGCGKTTLLRIVAGFEQPTTGRVFLGGAEVTGLAANQRNIGFVFQNYALFPHLTVRENVAYGLRVRGVSAGDIARAVGDTLALVGLAGYDRRFPHQLSGGEQQRVALARAVVIRPSVLLLDEPLSNLDAKLRVQMRGEIRRLQETLSITTVYVTHDQEEAMAVADRIAVMERGRVVQVGGAEDLYARPACAFVAQFIGRLSVVRGRVEGRVAGAVAVGVDGQVVRVPWTGADPEAGREVTLGLRPETIELGPAASDHDSGVVLSRVFLGEKVDYVVQWGSHRLLVCTYDPIRRGAFAPGDHVDVRLPGEAVPLVAEEPPA